MRHLTNLVRWEWFKVGHRKMPWVLLVILILMSQLSLWGSFFSYRSSEQAGPRVIYPMQGERRGFITVTCTDLQSGTANLPVEIPPAAVEGLRQQCQGQAASQHQVMLEQMQTRFIGPSSVVAALGTAQGVGLILIAILAASTVGMEYGWGTLRSVLVKGPGRWQFLAAKLALLASLVLIALVVVTALTAIGSAVASSLLQPTALSAAGSASWGDVFEMVCRTWVSFLPYIALAVFVAVLTGSTAAALGISLSYQFVEPIASAILGSLFEWFEPVSNYLLGRNITAWMQAGQPAGQATTGMIEGMGAAAEMPSEGHALLVMLAYMAVLSGLAFWLFLKRDIKGAGGE